MNSKLQELAEQVEHVSHDCLRFTVSINIELQCFLVVD